LQGQKSHCEPRLFVWRSNLTFRPLGGHCELVFSPFPRSLRARLFALPSVIASSSFRPSLGHCELVFSFAKQSQRFLAALRLGMTEEKGLGITKEKGLGMTEEGVIASLAFSSGEAISDCFASLATAKNAAGLLRFARSDAQKESLRGCLFVSEAVSIARLLRASGPRNDKRGKSLRGRRVVSEAVSLFQLLWCSREPEL
jgi:hypothetical protein